MRAVAEAAVRLEVFGEDADRAGVTALQKLRVHVRQRLRVHTELYHLLSCGVPHVRHDAIPSKSSRSLGHRRDERRRGGGPAVDRAQRAPGRAIGDALAARVGAVLPADGGCHHRALEPPSRSGRAVRVDAPRVRTRARVHLRLVRVGEQPVLLSVAAAVRRGEPAGGGGPAGGAPRRQPVVFDDRRPCEASPSASSSACGASAPAGGCNASG